MRVNLKVPFAQKDEAKSLGARWDPVSKVWYVQGDFDLSKFSRWVPSAAQSVEEVSVKRVLDNPLNKTKNNDEIGSAYFDLICDCLPWEGCEKCQAVLKDKKWTIND